MSSEKILGYYGRNPVSGLLLIMFLNQCNGEKEIVCTKRTDCLKVQEGSIEKCPKGKKCIVLCKKGQCHKYQVPVGCRSSKDCPKRQMCIKSKCFANIEENSTEKENKDLKLSKAKMQRSLASATKIKKAHSVGLGDPDSILKEL